MLLRAQPDDRHLELLNKVLHDPSMANNEPVIGILRKVFRSSYNNQFKLSKLPPLSSHSAILDSSAGHVIHEAFNFWLHKAYLSSQGADEPLTSLPVARRLSADASTCPTRRG